MLLERQVRLRSPRQRRRGFCSDELSSEKSFQLDQEGPDASPVLFLVTIMTALGNPCPIRSRYLLMVALAWVQPWTIGAPLQWQSGPGHRHASLSVPPSGKTGFF